MKKWILMVLVLLGVIVVSGCARALQKEYTIAYDNKKPKALLTREIEYDRIGDQKLSGLSAEKTEPNGVHVRVAIESQESEGKLQIEGLVSAIGEVVSAWMGVDGLTPEQITQLKEILVSSQ